MTAVALIVGINNYRHLAKLRKPALDANAIASALGRCSGFEYIKFLPESILENGNRGISTTANVSTTQLRDNILEVFHSEVDDGPDTALFFFAGHALRIDERGYSRVCLATSEASEHGASQGLDLFELQRILADSPVKHQIAWLDCCYSGALVTPELIDLGGVDRCCIAASRRYEKAYEQSSGEHGVLTAALLESLDPDAQPDGIITNLDIPPVIARILRRQRETQEPIFYNFGAAIKLCHRTTKTFPAKPLLNISPYVGLRYFDIHDGESGLFFGRESTVSDLLDHLRTSSSITITGASGSGKSSVVRAGLLYELKRGTRLARSERWKQIVFHPGDTPFQALLQALSTNAVITATQENEFLRTPSKEQFCALIDHHSATERLIVFIDQFEEVFSRCADIEARSHFLACLLHTNRLLGARFTLIMAMRSDYFQDCTEREYGGLQSLIRQNLFTLAPLDRIGLRNAISQPAKISGLHVDETVVDEMISRVEQEAGKLPLLEYTLTRMWECRDASTLSMETYRKVGGVEGALEEEAESVWKKIADTEKTTAKVMLLRLVRISDDGRLAKQKIRRDALERSLGNTSTDASKILDEIVRKFVDSRLIIADEQDGSATIELIHETLISCWTRFREWTEDKEALKIANRIHESRKSWEEFARDQEFLLSPGLLRLFRSARERVIPFLDSADFSFCKDSERFWDQQQLSRRPIKRGIFDNSHYIVGRDPTIASHADFYMAVATTVRDHLFERWINTQKAYDKATARTVCLLSAEYLPGPYLRPNLVNLDLFGEVRDACNEFGKDLDNILDTEEEPGLGSGGVGRLASCYLESLATNQLPAIGYGIRHEFGVFNQEFEDGWQVELSDNWLKNGNVWEIVRPRLRYTVGFGGRTEQFSAPDGTMQVRWIPDTSLSGVAFETPVPGFRVGNVNLMRLWKSEAAESFDFQAFNAGDYYGAVGAKISAETISKILYPNDEQEIGKELRLRQQYFLISCSLQDMIRQHLEWKGRIDTFCDTFVVQLNETHCVLAIPELMRLLTDEHNLKWDDAWRITTHCFCYTNHTLLPEALETWSISIFERLLPRHLELIYEINRRFLDAVRVRFVGDEDIVRRLSLIDETDDRRVRMANLAVVGCNRVNGVSEQHTKRMQTTLFKDFQKVWPDKIHNISNGVSPRQFLAVCNPHLSRLISETLHSDSWLADISTLRQLETAADDKNFLERWRDVKKDAKEELAKLLKLRTGTVVDTKSMFDVQAKRIHEYKRQLLNILNVIATYGELKEGKVVGAPRTYIFSGKAPPGYFMAKLIIKLINSVGLVVNHDPTTSDCLRVCFLPNFNVKYALRLYAAADLSEQLSLAGLEASGTGNMKFSMNGALTIGTLDGANIDIQEQVGAENFFDFGLTSDEVQALQSKGYDPAEVLEKNVILKAALDLINSGLFSNGDTELFRPLTESLLRSDAFMVLADFDSYRQRQSSVSDLWNAKETWTRMSVLNVARMGEFSSDRSIREFNQKAWRLSPVAVDAVR